MPVDAQMIRPQGIDGNQDDSTRKRTGDFIRRGLGAARERERESKPWQQTGEWPSTQAATGPMNSRSAQTHLDQSVITTAISVVSVGLPESTGLRRTVNSRPGLVAWIAIAPPNR